MSWKDVVCSCVVIIGVILFFFGSNYYNAIVGWAGVYLIIGGIFVEIILRVYEAVRRKKVSQKP